jgi:hypothetical protein
MKSSIGTAALAGSVVACSIFSGVSLATATTLDPVSFGSPLIFGLNAVAGNTGDPKTITDFGAYTSSSTVNQATAQAGATLSGGIDPAISATIEAAAGSFAHDPTGTGASVFAGVQLRYQFDFNGPATSVPMIVGANGLLTSSGGGSNEVRLQVFGNGVSIDLNLGCFGSGSCTQTFSGQSLNNPNFFTGSVYTVTMTILLNGGAAGGTNQDQKQTMTGSIDPMFTIDLANASDFTFEFSDGLIPPASATPVPAALPLFASGTAALGLLMRRRKRKQVA